MKTWKRTRERAWVARWKWPLLLGGGAAVWLLASKTASAGTPWGQGNASAAPAGTATPPANPGTYPIQAGTQSIPELPGSMAPTATQITDAASFWNSLGSGPGLSSGYINFPSGSQAAAAAFQVRYDAYGSPYVQWAGVAFILTGPDSMGNYTATQIQV